MLIVSCFEHPHSLNITSAKVTGLESIHSEQELWNYLKVHMLKYI